MKLVRNITSMFVLQVGSYIVPLLTIPYLSRTLGVEGFGSVGLAMAIAGYAIMVADWGFALSATQAVARASGDPHAVRQVFWDTMLAKAVLTLLVLAICAAIIVCTPAMRKIAPALPIIAVGVVAGSLNAFWFLQGLERMSRVAMANIACQALGLPLIFHFVRGEGDVLLALSIQNGVSVLASVISLAIAFRAAALTPPCPSAAGAWKQGREGASLFASNTAITLYTQSQVPILGFVSAPLEVGFYHGADRVRRAVQGLISPVSSAVYPRVNALVVSDPAKAAKLMHLMLLAQGLVTLGLSAVLFAAAPLIVGTFLGAAYAGAVPVLRCLSVLPFLIGVSNVLGINMMLPLGERAACTRIVSLAAVIGVGLLVPASLYYGAMGAAAATAATEGATTVMMAAWYFTRGRGMLRRLSGARGEPGAPAVAAAGMAR